MTSSVPILQNQPENDRTMSDRLRSTSENCGMYTKWSGDTCNYCGEMLGRGFEVVVDIEIVDQNNPKNPRLKRYSENEHFQDIRS
jgi:hypothetical protein